MNNNKTSSPDHTGQETRTIDQFVDKGSVNRTVSRL